MMMMRNGSSGRSRPSAAVVVVVVLVLCGCGSFRSSNGLVVPFSHRPTSPRRRRLSSSSSFSKTTSTTALRGIAGFRGWFGDAFPSAAVSVPSSSSSSSSSGGGEDEDDDPRLVHTFDHVLVDANQLLHTALRRSRDDGHALTLVVVELDRCLRRCRPRKSVVLALDGPPSAAKLQRQRRRRRRLVAQAATRRRRERSRARRRRATDADADADADAGRPPPRRRRRRRADEEEAALRITPGTAFLERAASALLYWAWQRMSNPRSTLGRRGVSVHLVSDAAPGEGEVKLLDWILRGCRGGVRPTDTVALLGGDSDLLLEGLVLDPRVCRDVFCVLPDEKRRSTVVSVWETTRALSRRASSRRDGDRSLRDVVRLRTDLVLLLVLNGNDYLPKLRGSSGFRRLLRAYERFREEEDADDDGRRRRWLTTFDETSSADVVGLDATACVAFFSRLVRDHEPSSLSTTTTTTSRPDDGDRPRDASLTALSNLQIMIDTGFLPGPKRFDTDPRDGSLTLVLGEDDEEERFTRPHPPNTKIKETKQALARTALETLLGEDYYEELFEFDGDDDDDEEEEDYRDNDDEEEDDDDDDKVSRPISARKSSWESAGPAEADARQYLAGVLWTLQTYRDGLCPDYSYNYGRRSSPTASQIVECLEEELSSSSSSSSTRTIDRAALLGEDGAAFADALEPGLSCAASLPYAARDLVPEPWSLLTEGAEDATLVDDIYRDCTNDDTGVLDARRFKDACEREVERLSARRETKGDDETSSPPRRDPKDDRPPVRIIPHHWTVLSHSPTDLAVPFAPPPPFSDRLSRLRTRRRIQVEYVPVTPRPPSDEERRRPRPRGRKGRDPSSLARDLARGGVAAVEHAVAFPELVREETDRREARRRKEERGKTKRRRTNDDDDEEEEEGAEDEERRPAVWERTANNTNRDAKRDRRNHHHDNTPLHLLQCLVDARRVPGPLSWTVVPPAPGSSEETTILALGDGGRSYEGVRSLGPADGTTTTTGAPVLKRRELRQRLAARALTEVFGNDDEEGNDDDDEGRWRGADPATLKRRLEEKNGDGDGDGPTVNGNGRSPVRSVVSAAASLQCLVDARCLPGPVEWSFETARRDDDDDDQDDNPDEETVVLRLGGGGGDGGAPRYEYKTVRRRRPAPRSTQEREEENGFVVSSSSTRKQSRQDLAARLLDDAVGTDWRDLTVQEMRSRTTTRKSDNDDDDDDDDGRTTRRREA